MDNEQNQQAHDHSHCEVASDRQVLRVVLLLNFSMFLLEIWQGIAASSSALLADSMDFLSDSFSYVITLHVLSRPLKTRAKAAMLKAFLMLMLAAGALMQGVYNLVIQHVPAYQTMGWVAAMALCVNVISAFMLYGSRTRDSNMHSVWLCSRNDAIANLFILIAAYLVFATGSLYPDLLVMLGIAWLEGGSAMKIIRHSKRELQS